MKSQESRLILRIEGIVCTGCATDMETALLATDGILKAAVSYADGTATIVYDPEEINEDALIAKVNSFGMKAGPAPSPS